ncbi:unnamed protein product [Peronospora effusa]|nr:unnamed protein product [Peronospora effusa]
MKFLHGLVMTAVVLLCENTETGATRTLRESISTSPGLLPFSFPPGSDDSGPHEPPPSPSGSPDIPGGPDFPYPP